MNAAEFNRQLSHAGVLLEQHRFVQAQEKLSMLIQLEPNDPDLLKMMTLCYMGLGLFEEVQFTASQLLKISPEESFAFYAMANASLNTRDLKKAEEHINEAIRIHPYIAEYFALKSIIHYQKKDFTQALESADIGLRSDPEHVACLNARASALTALDRNQEARDTIHKSLNTDPSNPDTHANIGWNKLRSGDVNEALLHFKTALTEEPTNEYAKAGMLQAMKARFPLYRVFLRIMLWVGKLSNQKQWYLIIGAFLIYRLLVNLAKQDSVLQPVFIGIAVLLVLIFLSTWLFSPLMNLYMLTNPYGKLTLTDHEKESAGYVGLVLGFGILSLFLFLIFENQGLLTLGGSSLLLMIPLGSMNNAFLEQNRKKLRRFAGLISILAFTGAMYSIATDALINIVTILALLALMIYQWYTNYVLIKE